VDGRDKHGHDDVDKASVPQSAEGVR
jgi:hypothetical protein